MRTHKAGGRKNQWDRERMSQYDSDFAKMLVIKMAQGKHPKRIKPTYYDPGDIVNLFIHDNTVDTPSVGIKCYPTVL